MLLTNEQIAGINPVVILKEKLDGETSIETTEGKIVRILQGDRQGVFAKVKIGDEIVERWIFAKYQKEAAQLNLTREKILTLYHYFTELSDALRPLLNTVNNEPEPEYWNTKLMQLKKVINEIIQPDLSNE